MIFFTDMPLGSELPGFIYAYYLIRAREELDREEEEAELLALIEDDEPIQVCPDCKRGQWFDTEWGLWCPICKRELKESELIYL